MSIDTTRSVCWPGRALAPGSAVAVSWRTDRPLPVGAAARVDPLTVGEAFAAVAADLGALAQRAKAQGRHAAGDIVGVAALIATDVPLVDGACAAAAVATDPLGAIHQVVEQHAEAMAALIDPTLRERAADIRQVGRRVIAHLARTSAADTTKPPARTFILVAEEIGPADILEHVGRGLAGVATRHGGSNSHAAIIARSVGLPIVTGLDADLLDLPDGTWLLVDADRGTVVVAPDETDIARAQQSATHRDEIRLVLAAERGKPHHTADGRPFTLMCNVATGVEAQLGLQGGAEGIGLLRTELPFLKANRWPDEADHRRALFPTFAEAGPGPVTVRLMDFANDKIPPFLVGHKAGLEALLDHPEALAAQLRAILALGRRLDLRIMVPMVTNAAQLRAVRAAVVTAAGQVEVRTPAVGAMVETVAAVESIHDLAVVADFFAIGTNDLAGEVLELARVDSRARPELAAHPEVLHLIGRVVTAGRLADRVVSVCGDAGANPATLPLLVGVGVRTFSVACARMDATRYLLRRLDTGHCSDVAAEAQRRTGIEEVLDLVQTEIRVHPEPWRAADESKEHSSYPIN